MSLRIGDVKQPSKTIRILQFSPDQYGLMELLRRLQVIPPTDKLWIDERADKYVVGCKI